MLDLHLAQSFCLDPKAGEALEQIGLIEEVARQDAETGRSEIVEIEGNGEGNVVGGEGNAVQGD